MEISNIFNKIQTLKTKYLHIEECKKNCWALELYIESDELKIEILYLQNIFYKKLLKNDIN